MVGHTVRKVRADIHNAQPVNQELRQLENAGNQGFEICNQRRITGIRGSFEVELAHHPNTRGRGSDDDLGVAKDLDKVPNKRQSLTLVAGVVVHLAAARLIYGEIDRVSEALQQPHHGTARLWK
jgi:hypothetical protein